MIGFQAYYTLIPVPLNGWCSLLSVIIPPFPSQSLWKEFFQNVTYKSVADSLMHYTWSPFSTTFLPPLPFIMVRVVLSLSFPLPLTSFPLKNSSHILHLYSLWLFIIPLRCFFIPCIWEASFCDYFLSLSNHPHSCKLFDFIFSCSE